MENNIKILFSRCARRSERVEKDFEREPPWESRYERMAMKWEDDMRAFKPSAYPTPEEARAALDALIEKTVLFNLPGQGLSALHKELVDSAEQSLRIVNSPDDLRNKPAAPQNRI